MHTLSVEDVVSNCLTFDDVLLVPRHAKNIQSRLDPDLSSYLGGVFLENPFISANMSTITELNMMVAMDNCGCLGILHRFLSIDEQCNIVKTAVTSGVTHRNAVSLGVTQGFMSDAAALYEAGARVFCVDVAHGDSAKVVNVIKTLRKELPPGITIIGGNVATGSGAARLAEAGASVVKVGVGPGSVCTTRSVAGVGVPQLTAVADVSLTLKREKFVDVAVVADGGIRTSGDIIKALAVGADAVMIGRLFAGTDEAPLSGKYFGMASKEAGRLREGIAAEGVVTTVTPQGSVVGVVGSLRAGLQTGMSYQDALTLSDLREDPQFVRVSYAGLMENNVRV